MAKKQRIKESEAAGRHGPAAAAPKGVQKASKKAAAKPATAAAHAEAAAAATKAHEQPAAATATASGGKQVAAAGGEIDDLFGSLKGKKAQHKGAQVAAGAEEQAAAAAGGSAKGGKRKGEAAAQPGKVAGSKDDIFGTEAGRSRKRTDDGFAIYSEEELGLGRAGGGNTDQCPFDCQCCF